MSNANHQIRDSITSIIANRIQNNIFICEVVAQPDGSTYNANENTIIVTSVGSDHVLDITDVRLNPNICDGFTPIPSIGSIVFVIKNQTDNQYYMLSSSDLDDIIISTNTQFNAHSKVVNISSTSVTTFNDGEHKGLVKVTELVDKINQLEKAYNGLLQAIQWAFIPCSTPSQAVAILSAFYTLTQAKVPISPITSITDLENPDITHGKKTT